MTRLKTGDIAPVFALNSTGANGKVNLKDYREKNVILFFYPRDHSPGCIKQTCLIRNHYETLLNATKRETIFFGISPDTIETHHTFVKKYNLPFPLLYDENHRVAEEYGIWGDIELNGVKYPAVIRSTFVIDVNGRIAAIFKNVKVRGHVEEVKQVLTKLD
jgi:peroxiredoxin Q/BCP